PDGTPFYCGTYFPPRPVGGMASFTQLLDAIHGAWQQDRDRVLSSADSLGDALARAAADAAAGGTAEIDPGLPDRALDRLAQSFDPAHAGFGGAPKFPPSTVLLWLLRHHARTGRTEALDLTERTCEAMARGGMYDQVAGGFARYSVDAEWVVPHFEKMLYDNALLLRTYTHLYRADGSPTARRVAEETAEWMLAELRTEEGGLASSLDADSEGAEGTYYVWTPDQLVEVLGEDDGARAAEVWSVTPRGTFEHGTSVLQLREDPADADWYARVRATVARARADRVPPARDDKVVVAWNAMAATALAEAGALLDRPEWVSAAEEVLALLLRVHGTGPGRLVRTSRGGVAGPSPAVLEDYAHLAEALLTLYQVTGSVPYLRQAEAQLAVVREQFLGTEAVHDTAADATDAALTRLGRPADPADGPTPAGASQAAAAFLGYAALTGSPEHREAALRCLAGPLGLAGEHPRATGSALAVLEALLDGPREVAVVGAADDPETVTLHTTALRSTAPGLVVALGHGQPDEDEVPLLRDRPRQDGRPTAYVCRQMVCRLPTTDPDELARQLARED
ncbi:DUF255 domain-containing protein, partial [Georgenia sp. 10Sc9-8]|nr:DUF255 domain-containing protein [Georgenia halotolerans]